MGGRIRSRLLGFLGLLSSLGWLGLLSLSLCLRDGLRDVFNYLNIFMLLGAEILDRIFWNDSRDS
jgi:hypothetical protein